MLIAGNWKLYKGPAEAAAFARRLREVKLPADVDVVVCPPYVSLGPVVESLTEARISADAALSALRVAHGWVDAPRPVHADDLLPERALAGDGLARATLISRIYRPLQAYSAELLTTLWCYLDNGRSLEATARELFVHPNTVRYRLKRVSEVIGWDATGAREALILQAALIVGSINEPDSPRRGG